MKEKVGKPIYKKWWFWILVLIVIEIIYCIGEATTNPEEYIENNDVNETLNIVEESKNEDTNGYQTSYVWEALEENAYQETIEETRILAVEIDDYDGAVLKAGTYKIYRRRFPNGYISLGYFLRGKAQ